MTTADNLRLLASARAIVEARRGPIPDALPAPFLPRSTQQVVAWMERASERDAYDREVRKVFRALKAGLPVPQVEQVSA